MSKNEQVVIDAAVLRDGKKKLSCLEAMRLSKENGISLKEIGEICNRCEIKIMECELGCFE
jgi:hypothetical protein